MKRDNKRIAIFLGHPAHFHLFKNVALGLMNEGFKVDFLIKRKDILEQLLINAGFSYFVVRHRERKGGSKIKLILSLIKTDINVLSYLIRFKPKMLLGTYSPIISHLYRLPIIVCNEDDADVVPRFAKTSYPFASNILVPTVCNCGKWNKKATKYNSYHELAYLHPNNFIPNKEKVEKYFSTDKPYMIMRFAKLSAHHDNGIKGISLEIAKRLIEILEPNMDVYITSERELDKSLERYRIKINPLDMHDIMAFASLYIGDSQTMAAEAGVLGVPFVRFNDFVDRIGYLSELEYKYILGYGIKTEEVEKLYKVVSELVTMDNRKEVFYRRREVMLSDKIDLSDFLINYIMNY
jgi:uncharacterized protein